MPNTITIIVAVAQNNAIGANNDLIWYIPEDLKRFKALTTGHHVIMGRKTFESIGRALPNRTNIVVTRNANYQAEGCQIVGSLEEALKISAGEDEVFVIGGGELYRQALPLSQRLQLTQVHASFDADTFFPAIDPTEWKEVFREERVSSDGKGLPFTFLTLERGDTQGL